MGYPKPNKQQRNEDYMRSQGMQVDENPYAEESQEQKKLFLIVCEGRNTEPLYFDSFPVPTKTIKTVGGCGSKTALVRHALQLQQEEDNQNREVWCVYDYDEKPDESATQPADFNQSIDLAVANGLKVAWSNDAFELWFLLHYELVETALKRHEIYPILKGKWNLTSFHREAKTEAFCLGNYKRHGGTKSAGQQLATRRAMALHQQYQGRRDYANHCPCTTVYQLVEELNNNLKE